MRMRSGDDVRPRFMDLRMNRKRGAIHRRASLHGLAAMIHQDQVRYADFAEVLAEAIDPEMVGEFRVPRGNVSGDSLIKSTFREQPERSRQPLLSMPLLFRDRRKSRLLNRIDHIYTRSDHAVIIDLQP